MLITKYTDLLSDVLPSLKADPSDPVTEYAIKRACIEFCAASWVWQYLPDPIDVVAGEAYYDVEPDSGSEVTAVMNVAHNGVLLDAKSVMWLDTNYTSWRTTQAVPKYYTQVDMDQVILAGVPDANITGGLTMTLALEPAKTATGLPKWICSQYLYSLAEGAISRLMLMPNKPWTDLAVGQDMRKNFEAATANARASSLAALGRATNRVTPQH